MVAIDVSEIEDKALCLNRSRMLSAGELLCELSASIKSHSSVNMRSTYFIIPPIPTVLDNGFYFVSLGGAPGYQPFKAKMITFKQYAQNPIKADELVYTCSIQEPAPPLQEIIFVDKGRHVFHGVITKAEDNKTYWRVTCRSMQYLLDFRVIPDILLDAADLNGYLASDPPVTVAETFGDISGSPASGWAANQFNLFKIQCTQSGIYCYLEVVAYAGANGKFAIYADSNGAPGTLIKVISNGMAVAAGLNYIYFPPMTMYSGRNYWIAFVTDAACIGNGGFSGGTRRYKSGTYSSFTFPATSGTGFSSSSAKIYAGFKGSMSIGALFMINSAIANGQWDTPGSNIHRLSGAGKKSQLKESDIYVCTSMPFITFDSYDGIIKLTDSGSYPPGSNQSYRDNDNLYILPGNGSYLPNALHVLAANAFDTKIRLGSLDIGTYKNTIPFSLKGQASKQLDDFFINIGREVQFLPGSDGLVYMNLAAEISRGSALKPVRRINDGEDDCRILLINQREPDCQAAIAIDSGDAAQPEYCLTDFSRTDQAQLFRIYDRKGTRKDETLYQLQLIIDNNDDSFSVVTRNVDWHIRVGDWVVLHRDEYGTIPVRVREIDYDNGIQTIICGKRIFTVSNKFSDYLRSSIPSNASPIQTTKLTAGAGSFMIKAADVKAGGLVIYFEDSFSTASEADNSVQLGCFCDLQVNSKIVPPGRIKLLDQTSVKIDITDFCNKSESADTVNTVTRQFWNASGWTSDGGKVTQYKQLKFLSP